jgi:RNA polymerase sigma-70 factor (ECF subfamily)
MGALLQERLARGEQAAFAELYDACADRLHHYLLVRLGSRTDADDALQETFLRLARMRERLAKVDSLEAYVFTVARHEAIRLAASRARQSRKLQPLVGDELFRVAPGNANAQDTAAALAAALGQLKPELREIVELKLYAGLTFQQISQVTDLPQGTVATRYRSALAHLRSWLARKL